MTDRLHVLRLPDTTCCGRKVRAIMLGDKPLMVEENTDRVLRTGGPTCKGCVRYLAQKGEVFDWASMPTHAASKRARPRRRSRMGASA